VTLDADSLLPERVRPLRRSEFERLVELGVFDDERVELLGGVLIEMSPQGASHSTVSARLHGLLHDALRRRAEVRAHSPIALSDDSEPEPDVAVVPLGDYGRELPSEAHLVVEVSDSSLRKDRRIKTELYASAGVPEYWIVNLVERVVEMHRAPADGRYTDVKTCRPGERVALSAFPDVEVDASQLLR
jgi:Uma2 family endonuclease